MDGDRFTLADFTAVVAGIARLDPADVGPEARLIDDLRLDSMGLVELVVALEECGIPGPEDVVRESTTVEATWRLCVAAVAASPA